MNSKTYLSKYQNIVALLSYRVNSYLTNLPEFENIKYPINDNFFLQYLHSDKKYYNKIIITQKGKQRTLYEPDIKLKYIQKFILNMILYTSYKRYNFSENVTGFIKDTNILDNAYPHLNKKAIIKLDIKDFFPSISRTMIFNILKKYNNFSYEYCYILSKLVTYNNFLPQGSPTSPFLANICAKGIDYRIIKLIDSIKKTNNLNINYTRFADDITISFDKSFNYDYVINVIYNIILDEGFFPNYKKTRVVKNSQCQKVTGIVVNHNELRIETKEIKKIFFVLTIWKKYGILDAIKIWNKHKFGTKIIDTPAKKKEFIKIIKGKLSYFHMINPNQCKKLDVLFQENNLDNFNN